MNRRPNRTWPILAGLLSASLLLALAGCGGQQGGQSGNADSLSAAPEGGADQGSAGDTRAQAPRRAAPKTYTLPANTPIVAALSQTIATDKNKVGDKISLRTTEAVKVGEAVAIPAGATINGEVTHIDPAGRIAGGAELTLGFHELVLADGTSLPITCEPFVLKGKGQAKESALEVGGGAVAGGVVGGLLGGKKDIAKGAAVGAVLGTGVAIATKGDQIVLPVGQKLNVTVKEPVTVTVKPSTS
jgi:hypothetical protein